MRKVGPKFPIKSLGNTVECLQAEALQNGQHQHSNIC